MAKLFSMRKNMSRPLRLEFAGALYHITSWGNGNNRIYFQNNDFENKVGQVLRYIHDINR